MSNSHIRFSYGLLFYYLKEYVDEDISYTAVLKDNYNNEAIDEILNRAEQRHPRISSQAEQSMLMELYRLIAEGLYPDDIKQYIRFGFTRVRILSELLYSLLHAEVDHIPTHLDYDLNTTLTVAADSVVSCYVEAGLMKEEETRIKKWWQK